MDFDGITNARTLFATAMQKQAANAAAQAGGANVKKFKAAAQQFEAFFVGEMMDNMTASLEPDAIFGGGHGEEMWRPMLNQEYGKEVAKSGRLGIAKNVMAAMLKAQEQRTQMAQGATQGAASGQPAAAAAGAGAAGDAVEFRPLQPEAAYLPLQGGTAAFRPLKGK